MGWQRKRSLRSRGVETRVIIAWLSAFVLTQLVECPIYVWALRPRRNVWAWAFLASAITHPLVFFVFPTLELGSYWNNVAYAEAFAVCIEAAYLSALSVRYSVLWALLANGTSLVVGLTLRHWAGWP